MSRWTSRLGRDEAIERAASLWVLRRDRGLSPKEQDEFTQWLATDERHRRSFARLTWGWEELDRLAGLQSSAYAIPTADPDLLADRRIEGGRRWRRLRLLPLPLAAAAAAAGLLVLARISPNRQPARETILQAPIALCEEQTLADGSVVKLNRGATLKVDFSASVRQVRLERGEAHFQVAKDAARPFVVDAVGVEVRAVGTAFDVRLGPQVVAVVVDEGRVRVARPGASSPDPEISPVGAGQAVSVPLDQGAPVPNVVTLSAASLDSRLAWLPRMLDFTDTPLTEIAAEFNRHNPTRLILDDPSLGGFRLSASFRSDNVEGFIRLMESQFDLAAERRGEADIVLRRLK